MGVEALPCTCFTSLSWQIGRFKHICLTNESGLCGQVVQGLLAGVLCVPCWPEPGTAKVRRVTLSSLFYDQEAKCSRRHHYRMEDPLTLSGLVILEIFWAYKRHCGTRTQSSLC